MDAVLRATAIYLVLTLVFRFAGRRSLAEFSNFDFVLLLIIGEATQQALLGNDFSMTNAIIVIVTLVGIDVAFSFAKGRTSLEKIIDGVPMIVVEDGQLLERRMRLARISEDDVLVAARKLRGLESLDQIKYAVLEQNGEISVIPRRSPPAARRRGRTERRKAA